MKENNLKGWLYILPAFILLGFFMIYPLVDVLIYSFEEGYSFVSGTSLGMGLYNYKFVLNDPYFLDALKNTFIVVIITVPLSTLIALLISVGLNSISKLKSFLQSIYFLPYITNTLAIGLVFLIMFDLTPLSKGLFNSFTGLFGIAPIDFIDGSYASKMFVLCLYVIWQVMPFKILILTTSLANVNKQLYQAASVDGASRWRVFSRITVPSISPMLFYLIITGFIGAFKEYNNAVSLFGVNLDGAGMNTIVGYVYNMLYSENGGFPSYASAAAIILFMIVLTITVINLMVKKKTVTQ